MIAAPVRSPMKIISGRLDGELFTLLARGSNRRVAAAFRAFDFD